MVASILEWGGFGGVTGQRAADVSLSRRVWSDSVVFAEEGLYRLTSADPTDQYHSRLLTTFISG